MIGMRLNMRSRVLIVDDEKMVRWGLKEALTGAGYDVVEAATVADAIKSASNEPPDLVLLDYQLPDGSGIEVLKHLKTLAQSVPAIMITAHASIGGAVEAMKAGAYDYLSKPFEVDDVLQTVERALEAGRLREQVARQREDGRKSYLEQHIIAESDAMKEVLRLVRRVATSEATTILLLGDSGVGKGLIARALHFEGAAWDRPFMHITCTALPETLLESELFGHEKGAFTDAKMQKKGLFELADGGTAFLDEIGDLSAGLQAKLLRFLEDKSFRRVGGTRDIHVSLRIIAATNKDLELEVEEGRFRRDLYYRLKVIPIEIPRLRARIEDIAPMAQSFVQHFNREFRKSVRGLEPEAIELMRQYPWPGNVRELRNAIERAVLLTDSEWLSARDLPNEIRAARGSRSSTAEPSGGLLLPTDGLVLEEVEKTFVRQALERTRGNRTRAARLLGMNRDQIRYRIEKYALEDAVAEEDDGSHRGTSGRVTG